MDTVERRQPLRIFCGYAHEDRALFEQLQKAFAVLLRQKQIVVWHYGELLPGAEWESEIERQLDTADIILLLISPSFIASDYCWSKEMQWAITRHSSGEARVLPILLKPTSGWKSTPLGKLQALPTGAKPITNWDKRDDALADVVNGLQRVIQDMQFEESYDVREYRLISRAIISNLVDLQEVQTMAISQAEQWMDTILQAQVGKLQQTVKDPLRIQWTLTDHHQVCDISIDLSTPLMPHPCCEVFCRYVPAAHIILSSKHLALLSKLVEACQLPYHVLEWTLSDSFDLYSFFDNQIVSSESHLHYTTLHEISPRNYLKQVQFKLSEGMYVLMLPKQGSSPVKICLCYPEYEDNIHDKVVIPGSFFYAHRLFSIRKVVSILRGDLSPKQIRQLIAQATTP